MEIIEQLGYSGATGADSFIQRNKDRLH